MPAADTVATLNQVGGKSAPASKTRFKARVTDVFSPEKASQPAVKESTPRTRLSGKLKLKRLSQPESSANRRNALSPPHDSDDQTPAPKPKKRVIQKTKKTSEDKSPLKKHGYDLDLKDNPKVNLGDSPAKNTRSKNHNPLETLAKANLPIPDSLAKLKQNKPQDNKKVEKKQALPTAGTEVTLRKRKRDEASDRTQPDGAEAEIIDCADGENDEVEQGQEQVKNPGKQDGSEPNTKCQRRRPSTKSKAQQGQEQEKEQETRSAQTSSTTKEQLDKVEEAEKEEFQAQRTKFAIGIEKSIQIHNCREFWMNLGGATCMIERTGIGKASSARGKAASRVNDKLKKAYNKLQTQNCSPSPKQDETISTLVKKLGGRCNLLSPVDNRAANFLIIKDMFLVIVPELVQLMKAFLRGRCQRGYFGEKALRELLYLLDMTINVCVTARSWEPQPRTLQSGVRRWMRNDVLANLRRIRERCLPDLARYDRVVGDRMVISELAEKQTIAREQQAQLLASIKMKRKQQWSRSNVNIVQQNAKPQLQTAMLQKQIYDIDDVEDQLVVPISRDIVGVEAVATTSKAATETNSRLRREPTAELPPPLSIDLSEEEKVALLNGLQMYTGEDRYNDILNDHDLGTVLKKRDLDDLVQAARSFSQMMASKMGLERYQNNVSFLWLRSVDPEVQDNASVVL